MAPHPYVTQLENRLRAYGIKVKPDTLDKVLRLMNWNVELAQDAFLMVPQPPWLREMVGPRELQERR